MTTAPAPAKSRLADGVEWTGRGPRPPERGAWFGAFVQAKYREGKTAAQAVSEFELEVGRQLAIVHYFRKFDEQFPKAADEAVLDEGRTLLLSWASTDTRSIALGRHDDLIRARAQEVKALGKPFLLRFRWEMDRPNLTAQVHSPEDYIAAWRHVHDIFDAEGATNVAWVWCPLATGFLDRRAQAYYPGDDQVDWVCADAYAGKEFLSLEELMTPVVDFAEQRRLPVLVGEFGVQDRGTGLRPEWLREAHDYLRQNERIKGLVYFYARQDAKPRYDLTFAGDPESLQAFRELVRTTVPAASGG